MDSDLVAFTKDVRGRVNYRLRVPAKRTDGSDKPPLDLLSITTPELMEPRAFVRLLFFVRRTLVRIAAATLVRMGPPRVKKGLKSLERVNGIEPSSSAWKAVALPLSYTRNIRRLP